MGKAVADDRRLHLQAEVLGDVEHRQLGINVGIDDREGVDAHHDEEAHVAPAAVLVLTVLEDRLVTLLVGWRNLLAQVQELVV